MASLINIENLWSDSLTKHVLTVYAEGLAYINVDKNLIYNLMRHNNYTWYILEKLADEEGELTSTNQLV